MTQVQSHFVFVLEAGFTMQAFSSAVEVLRLARKLTAQHSVDYSVATLDGTPVAASNGVEVLPNCPISDLPKGAILVMVSGAGIEATPNPRLVAQLRRWSRHGHPIWGISSGVVRLAQAGLVDGCKTAAHWEDLPFLSAHHPRVDVSTSLFVLDAKHPTCAGGTAAADLMLSYLAQNGADDLVDEIASRLMIDGLRDGRLHQALPAHLRYSTSNRTVFAAMRLMDANLYTALALSEIARRAGVSQRQLERLFKAEFGSTPKRVYLDLRLGAARQEVLAGQRPVRDIAGDYGFEPAAFARAYHTLFGESPSASRRP